MDRLPNTRTQRPGRCKRYKQAEHCRTWSFALCTSGKLEWHVSLDMLTVLQDLIFFADSMDRRVDESIHLPSSC